MRFRRHTDSGQLLEAVLKNQNTSARIHAHSVTRSSCAGIQIQFPKVRPTKDKYILVANADKYTLIEFPQKRPRANKCIPIATLVATSCYALRAPKFTKFAAWAKRGF